MMASSNLFREFMKPIRSSLIKRKDESELVYNARHRVKNILHKLTESLLSGFVPYEEYNANLMNRLISSLNHYVALDNIILDGSLGKDQFDAQEIFNLLFDIIDFGKHELFQLQQLITFEKMNGTVIKRYTEQTSARIFVDLDGVSNLQQAVSKSLDPIVFKDENKYFYDKEKQYIDAKKIVSVKNTPEFLIIVMKRYAYDKKTGSQKRISKKITVPDQIRLNQVGINETNRNEINRLYRRLAAIVHHGKTPHFGHYSCYLWRNETRPNKKRVLTASHHDDSHITECIESKTMKSLRTNAYILVYQLEKNVSI